MKQKIEEIIKRYGRQLERCSVEAQKGNDGWNIGYFDGKRLLYSEIIDDLKELLDGIDTKKENVPFEIPFMEQFERNFTVHKNEKILLGSISICELHGSCLGKKVGFYIVEDDINTVIYPLSNHDSFLISYTKLREFN